jgi:cellulose synthase/poly-beta-1,6-N-acetylglucosamine synthase-like glycosyltransferase
LILFLNIIFAVIATFMAAYLTRHYLFTLAALYHKKEKSSFLLQKTEYQPNVSVLIPARNEAQVIERILQRMIVLTYPKEKIEVIVINDASTDGTGEKAEKFAKEHEFIKVVHRGPERGERENQML